tara:strand:+ start:2445 stop:2705 length:261 start_codon:yes stop_codon:yes gene_type:complete
MSTIKQLQEENKKLQEENKKLKSQLHDLNIAFFTSSTEEAAKIKQLKEQLKSAEDLNVIYYRHMVKMGCEKGCCSLDIDGNPMLKP